MRGARAENRSPRTLEGIGSRRAKVRRDMPATGVALSVIRAMQAELPRGGLSLPDMADIAHLSQFHFIRSFRDDVGLPPGAFQAALRLAEAKRLLRETDASVTDVCFDLGYASLGTFVTRFTTDVGVSPSRYRVLCREVEAASRPTATVPRAAVPPPGVTGKVTAGTLPVGPVFLGLFPRLLPSALPVAGTAVWGGGPFALDPVADGVYVLLAAGCPAGTDLQTAVSHDRPTWVGVGGPVEVRDGRSPVVTVALRPPAPTDPPVLVAIPLLMARATTRWAQRR